MENEDKALADVRTLDSKYQYLYFTSFARRGAGELKWKRIAASMRCVYSLCNYFILLRVDKSDKEYLPTRIEADACCRLLINVITEVENRHKFVSCPAPKTFIRRFRLDALHMEAENGSRCECENHSDGYEWQTLCGRLGQRPSRRTL